MNTQKNNKRFGKTRKKESTPVKMAYISKDVIDAIRNANATGGYLFGRKLGNENVAQILGLNNSLRGIQLDCLGRWEKQTKSKKGLSLIVSNNDVMCFDKIALEIFDINDYNIRNRSEILSQNVNSKKALLVSCGSVNSRIGYELAKHGIEITVTDPDKLDIANPYRWGIQEPPEFFIGRPKTEVFKEAIIRNIPNAKITAFTKDFCQDIVFFDNYVDFWKPDLIIIATDTEDSRRDVNSIGILKKIPVLYVALSDKAESGQIIFISGTKEDPCYLCFKGNNEEHPFTLRSTNKQYGIDTTQEQRAVPALSIDINIISDIATKLAMVILAGEDVTQYLKQFDNKGYIMWFSTKPDSWVLEDAFQKLIAILEKNPSCPVCGDK